MSSLIGIGLFSSSSAHQELVCRCSSCREAERLVVPKEVVHGIYRSVAMAVVRGNNNVVQGNLFRSRLAEW